jgi:hypothetical protein
MLIQNSNLQELSRDDLIEYKNLKSFACIENPISFLPGNLFNDLWQIKSVVFIKNQLKIIEPNILDGLDKLKYVRFGCEPNYDIGYSIHDHLCTLDAVKNCLQQKFSSTWMWKENRDLKQECWKLKQENEKLKMENGALMAEKSQVNSNPDKGLIADFKKYIDDENTKDFKIIADGREFHVHQIVLAIRSPILAIMLQERPKADSLTLADISAGMFARILKFLYTDEVPRDVNLLYLYTTASKLQIKDLKEYAAMKIMDSINGDNALEIFELSCKYDHEELKIKAYAEIKKKYPLMYFSDEWLIKSEMFGKIIKGLQELEQEEAGN